MIKIKIIYKGRGTGKTTQLLYSSDTTRIPIVVATLAHKKYLIMQALELGLNIPEPLTVLDVQDSLRGNRHIQTCYVDNAESVLRSLLGVDISAISISNTEEKVIYHIGNGILNRGDK